MTSTRPTPEDRDALRMLLQREDMSDSNAEFLEFVRNWNGAWTDRMCARFDRLCFDYFGACSCIGWKRSIRVLFPSLVGTAMVLLWTDFWMDRPLSCLTPASFERQRIGSETGIWIGCL